MPDLRREITLLSARGAAKTALTAPAEVPGLSSAELQQLVLQLLSENAEQKRAIVELREEIARLKGLNLNPAVG